MSASSRRTRRAGCAGRPSGSVARQAAVADSPTSTHDLLADDRTTDLDVLIDARDALAQIKPDQARALIARALGLRYREICDAFAWTYTKTNRCVTEGRAAPREQLGD